MSKAAIAGAVTGTINDTGLTAGATAQYRIVARINSSPPTGTVAAPAAGATLSFTGKVEITS